MTEPDRPITYGVVKPGPEDPDRGIPFVRGGDIRDGKIALGGLRTITESVSRPYARTLLKGGEVLISLVGNPGEVAIAPDSLAGANIARQAGLIALRAEFNARYVMYFLRSPVGRAGLFERTQGAVQQVINLAALKTIKIQLPEPPEQARIATILSAYDELIENNRRRITLLEEAARQLYKEWFVRFRFPGHEHVKIIGGVPAGWERLTLRDVATLHYGKALKDEVRIPGDVPVYGSSGIVGSHDRALVAGPAIILGRKGNVGSVRWSHSDFFPIDTVYFISNEQSDFHLYLTLMHMHFMSTDVAVPGLNREFAYSRPLVRPSSGVGVRFEEEVTPIFRQVQNLIDWNAKLSKARDLLLPKLMSGAIPV